MRRIYIVEDEAIVALGLRQILTDLGYDVCGHALRARVALEQIPVLRPDLVLMDIHLGPGMSGIDLVDHLREQIDVPVVFVTAYADAEISGQASRVEAYSYVLKPFLPQELRANIDLALHRHDSEMRFRRALHDLEEMSATLHLRTLELEKANVLLRWAFESRPDGLLVIDLIGQVERMNTAFTTLFAVPPDVAAVESAAELLGWCARQMEDPARFLAALPGAHDPPATRRDGTWAMRDGRTLAYSVEPRRIDGANIGRVLRFQEAAPPPIATDGTTRAPLPG